MLSSCYTKLELYRRDNILIGAGHPENPFLLAMNKIILENERDQKIDSLLKSWNQPNAEWRITHTAFKCKTTPLSLLEVLQWGQSLPQEPFCLGISMQQKDKSVFPRIHCQPRLSSSTQENYLNLVSCLRSNPHLYFRWDGSPASHETTSRGILYIYCSPPPSSQLSQDRVQYIFQSMVDTCIR